MEAKMKCINVQTGLYDRPFHLLCRYHDPLDIAERIVDIMEKDFLFLKDYEGNTCLHKACDYNPYEDQDDDYVPEYIDFEVYCKFNAFLLSRGGWKLFVETNNEGETALYYLMMCKLTNLECVKLVVKAGGDKLLAFQDAPFSLSDGGNTIPHYASWRSQLDREIINHLVSVGGSRLTEMKNNDGFRAEDDWSDELKEYIEFTTKTLPALSDDLQFPFFFDTLYDVHVISQCCHRFCKRCITQSYEKRGNTCSRIFNQGCEKGSIVGQACICVKEEKDAKDLLQTKLSEQISESQKEIIIICLREQLQNALKQKHGDL